MVLPCVEYAGTYYRLKLDFYPNPADPSGLYYWQFNSVSTAAASSQCARADGALTINVPCVYYGGRNLSITLQFYQNPALPPGIYWKLIQPLTSNPVVIDSISGDTMELMLPYYQNMDFQNMTTCMMTCMMQCGQDVACLTSCMPNFGIGSIFSLAVTLCNSTSTPVIFVIPAGAFFIPEDDETQPMLVMIDQYIEVPALTGGMECHTYLLPTFCMNLSAHAPGDTDNYTVHGSGIASYACIQEILDLIAGKTELSGNEANVVQYAVWECMEDGSITEERRTQLENL
jgi:hypothetical protein